MKLEVKLNPKTSAKEVFIDDFKFGYLEQLSFDNENYCFMSDCPHEKLTGDHYILIGQHLNLINESLV